MIARMWRGWARTSDADRYDEHYRTEVLTALRALPGFCGANLVRRTGETETEFVSVTFFTDLDAVRGFAGADYQQAVVSEAARAVLVRFDERVLHLDVTVQK
jgi:heme-degrading monooxygenase HmoA